MGGARAALALATLACVLLASLPSVDAHAQLLSSEPMAGAVLDAAPRQVTVQLTEPVDQEATSVEVLDSQDNRVDMDDLAVLSGDNPVLTISLKPDLPDGAYVISWATLSGTDGHHSAGTIGFAVGQFTPPSTTTQSVNKLDPASAAARALSYTGFALVFASAAFFVVLAHQGYPELVLRRALLWGTTAHLAGAILIVTQYHSAGLAWGQFPTSDVGRVLLARLFLGAAAWALSILATIRWTRSAPFAVTFLMFGAAVGSARLAHGWSDGPITMALDVTHLLAASVWVGGLLLLAWFMHKHAAGLAPEQVRQVARRFGTIALAAVILIVFTGLVVAIAILGRERVLHPIATMQSAYGAFLAAKVGLAIVMVAVAAVNRYVFLEAQTTQGVAGALQKITRRASLTPLQLTDQRGLRRAVAVEAALGCIVLVLAGLLTSVSPPMAAAEPQVVLTAQGDHHIVHLIVAPSAKAGERSMLSLDIRDAQTLAPIGNRTGEGWCGFESCVSLQIAYAGLNGTEEHTALPMGIWMVHDVLWTRPGTATVHVDIQTADVFHDEVTFLVPVA